MVENHTPEFATDGAIRSCAAPAEHGTATRPTAVASRQTLVFDQSLASRAAQLASRAVSGVHPWLETMVENHISVVPRLSTLNVSAMVRAKWDVSVFDRLQWPWFGL